MKILMISLDKSVFNEFSPTAARMMDYGKICEELHVIVFGAPKKTGKLAENVFVYGAGANRIRAIFSAIKLGSKVLKGGEWLITAQDPFETGFVGWLLSKKYRTALEIQLHGDFYGNNYWKKERLLNQFRYYLGKFILKKAGMVRAVSERIKKSVLNFAKASIKVLPIYSGLEPKNADCNFLKHKLPGSYPILLAVGNLVPVKNYQLLIEVFADIKKYFPGAKLVIAGEGPLLKDLRLQIANLGLEDSVELAGHQENLRDYYASSDIFVHPSLYEGWGRVIVEASTYDLPIIMSDVGLAGEIIKNEESGLIVPVNNKEALKEAILRLAKDKDLQKKLAEAAKKTVEQKMCSKEEYLAKIKESWEAG